MEIKNTWIYMVEKRRSLHWVADLAPAESPTKDVSTNDKSG